MRIVDAHVHLYPAEVGQNPSVWAEARGERHWALLCARVRKNGQPVQGFPSVDALLRAMDLAGVERSILQGWYWENHYTCAAQNRFYADCVRAHPDRLSASATFHPQAGWAKIEAELREAKQRGFCGIGELSPHSQLYSVDEPVWRAALDLAAELQLPVNLHVTEPNGRGYPGRVLTPLQDFVRLAREHPATTFVLAHWAARLPVDPALGAEAQKMSNVYYDTAASPLLYGPEVFREIIAAVGVERVLFGSDFPLILYPKTECEPTMSRFIADIRSTANLSEKEQAELFGDAARRVYRLP